MKRMIFVLALVLTAHTVAADPATHVYQCTVDGQRVFSDHACGDDAVERDISVTSRMDTIKVSNDKPSKTKGSLPSRRHSDVGSDDHDKRRQQCARIQKSRDAVNDKMRAGYTAKQDERLHERLRKLDNDYFQLRCSGVH